MQRIGERENGLARGMTLCAFLASVLLLLACDSPARVLPYEPGEPGAPGSPGTVLEIGSNGNWWIDGEDTGIPAAGSPDQQGSPRQIVPATGFYDDDLDGSYLVPGYTRRLRLDVYPSAAAVRTVLWLSSDPTVLGIAGVPREGRSWIATVGPATEIEVTGVTYGTATLTAMAIGGDGGQATTASVTINVYRPYRTVTFHTGEGSAVPAYKLRHGFPVARPDPTPAEYVYGFTGWHTDSCATTLFDFATPITADKTLYAGWALLFNVRFELREGVSPAPTSQMVLPNQTAQRPASPLGARLDFTWDWESVTLAGLYHADRYSFAGWYHDGAAFCFDTPITGDITLVDRWSDTPLPIDLTGTEGASVVDRAVNYINANPGTYFLFLDDDVSLDDDVPLARGGRTLPHGTQLTLRGLGGERLLKLTSHHHVFDIGLGAKLTLDGGIVLRFDFDYYGQHNYNPPLALVRNAGTLVMNEGARITGNNGGGVYVVDGTFAMHGGEISGNYGGRGGVSVTGGTFTMYGGKIFGNTGGLDGVGGVRVTGGAFIMYGGEIFGNTAHDGGVGGVRVTGGTFTMHGGEIFGNTSVVYNNNDWLYAGAGGGVSVTSGTFTMYGGEIFGNTTHTGGGGVYVARFTGGGMYTVGTFTMNGGKIFGNTTLQGGGGGGVGVRAGTFAMYGGEIFGNTTLWGGGGVRVWGGTVWITTGVIYGIDAGDRANTVDSFGLGMAALYGGAQRRTHDGIPQDELTDTDYTIRVLNGALVD